MIGAWVRREAAGLALVALAVVLGAVGLAPELRIGVLPPNDAGLHLAASERMALHFARGEPFLDPWVSEWSLGYPLWRSYQPLPHVLGAAWLTLAGPLFADPFHAFAALQYLLMVLLPLSFWLGARGLGLAPLAAGLAALLALAPSAVGDMGRYGLSYGAFTWRGSGLYTQLVALHLLLPALALIARSLDGGRGRLGAAALLALTSLSHIVFGYVGFVSAALLAAFGARGEAPRRLSRLLGLVLPALAALAWFVIPLFLARHEVNHSRWEDAVKWDSYGFRVLVSEIARGNFFDAWRKPALSALVAAGLVSALVRLADARARRLVALSAAWFALYAGREAWGHLLLLVGMPGEFHIHRLQAAFEIAILLTTAYGIHEGLEALRRRVPALALAGLLATVGLLGYLAADRAAYLRQNHDWGVENLAAWNKDREALTAALAEVRAILAEKPGRVSAGKAAEWGRDFKVGSVPVYAFTTREHLDQVSFLYHSMSLTSDVMVHRNEDDLAHDVLFGVRAVLAPAERSLPGSFRRRAVHGRFAVWEASPEGYFGLVELGSRYTGPRETHYEPSKGWLDSVHLRHGIVVSLDQGPPGLPTFGRWQPIPPPDPRMLEPRGRIVSESKEGEVYRAVYELARPAWALVKLTFHPDLVARVDGARVELVRVTPGFAAAPVPAGRHEVEVRYAPGPLKPGLFVAGLLALAAAAWALRRPATTILEESLASHIAAVLDRLATPRARATLAIIFLSLIAFRPLFRGRLLSGHDATEYPPRLVEFARAIREGHLPPIWAPDLGGGRGQPLFAFAPPLVYSAALPLYALGARTMDALQIGLWLLHLAGAAAVYRIARRLGAERDVGIGVTAAWCFAPYVSLDLFVRTAFAEAAAVAVSPVALTGLLAVLDRPSSRRLAVAAAGIALVPLGHNAAALLLFPALALVVLARAGLETAERRGATARWGALALASGLGLSAWFWLPALAEKDWVKTHLLRQDFLHWTQHALAGWQLLWSRWGFGVSQPGTEGDGMSFALGPAHLALALASLVLVSRAGTRAERALFGAFALAAGTGAFLSTTWAAFLWQRIETLQYMAYPWRALGLPGLFLPLLALPALRRLGPRGRAFAVGALIVLNLPHTEPKGYLTYDEEFYQPASIASRELRTTTREEYEPRWVKETPRFTRDRLLGQGAPLRVETREHRCQREALSVVADAATRAETAALYYPGMSISVNGVEVALEPEPTRGTMLFQLPAGSSEVVIQLRSMPARRAAYLLSAITAAVLLAGALLSARRPDAVH